LIARVAVVGEADGAAGRRQSGQGRLCLEAEALDVGKDFGRIDADEPHAQLATVDLEPQGVAVDDRDDLARAVGLRQRGWSRLLGLALQAAVDPSDETDDECGRAESTRPPVHAVRLPGDP